MTTRTPVAYVYVSDADRALNFYTETLGLTFRDSDAYGHMLDAGGGLVRLTKLGDFKPHEHPVFGLEVADFDATFRELRARGVSFTVYDGMTDKDGVYATDDGSSKMAWFADSEGNVLMLSMG